MPSHGAGRNLRRHLQQCVPPVVLQISVCVVHGPGRCSRAPEGVYQLPVWISPKISILTASTVRKYTLPPITGRRTRSCRACCLLWAPASAAEQVTAGFGGDLRILGSTHPVVFARYHEVAIINSLSATRKPDDFLYCKRYCFHPAGVPEACGVAERVSSG